MPKIIALLSIAVVVAVVGYFGLIWHNNVAVKSPMLGKERPTRRKPIRYGNHFWAADR